MTLLATASIKGVLLGIVNGHVQQRQECCERITTLHRGSPLVVLAAYGGKPDRIVFHHLIW